MYKRQGYGLSYTSFHIGEAQLNKTQIKTDESLAVTIPVTNTGKRNGTEIVQMYVKKVNDTNGAIKTLRGFKRTEVIAGKTVNAVIDLHPSAFEFYNSKTLKMDVTAGEYELWYGNSSAVKDLRMIKITIQ